MKIVERKDLSKILQEKFPKRRFSVILEDDDGTVVVNYDAYMVESEVNKLSEFIDTIPEKIRLERMPF